MPQPSRILQNRMRRSELLCQEVIEQDQRERVQRREKDRDTVLEMTTLVLREQRTNAIPKGGRGHRVMNAVWDVEIITTTMGIKTVRGMLDMVIAAPGNMGKRNHEPLG